MKPTFSFRSLLRTLTFITALGGITLQAADPLKIVLVAGTVKEVDRPGHHDYLGGCRLMQALLGQTEGVEAALVTVNLALYQVRAEVDTLRAAGPAQAGPGESLS